MLGHVYVVEDAKDLAQIVRDVTRYGGAYRPEVRAPPWFRYGVSGAHWSPNVTSHFPCRTSTSSSSAGRIGKRSRRQLIKQCITSASRKIALSVELLSFWCGAGVLEGGRDKFSAYPLYCFFSCVAPTWFGADSTAYFRVPGDIG